METLPLPFPYWEVYVNRGDWWIVILNFLYTQLRTTQLRRWERIPTNGYYFQLTTCFCWSLLTRGPESSHWAPEVLEPFLKGIVPKRNRSTDVQNQLRRLIRVIRKFQIKSYCSTKIRLFFSLLYISKSVQTSNKLRWRKEKGKSFFSPYNSTITQKIDKAS